MKKLVVMAAACVAVMMGTGCVNTMAKVNTNGTFEFNRTAVLTTTEIKSATYNPTSKAFALESYSMDVNQQAIATIIQLATQLAGSRAANAAANSASNAIEKKAATDAAAKAAAEACPDGNCTP